MRTRRVARRKRSRRARAPRPNMRRRSSDDCARNMAPEFAPPTSILSASPRLRRIGEGACDRARRRRAKASRRASAARGAGSTARERDATRQALDARQEERAGLAVSLQLGARDARARPGRKAPDWSSVSNHSIGRSRLICSFATSRPRISIATPLLRAAGSRRRARVIGKRWRGRMRSPQTSPRSD